MNATEIVKALREYTYWCGSSGPASHDIHPQICDVAADLIEQQEAELAALKEGWMPDGGKWIPNEEIRSLGDKCGQPLWLQLLPDDLWQSRWVLIGSAVQTSDGTEIGIMLGGFGNTAVLNYADYGQKWKAWLPYTARIQPQPLPAAPEKGESLCYIARNLSLFQPCSGQG